MQASIRQTQEAQDSSAKESKKSTYRASPRLLTILTTAEVVWGKRGENLKLILEQKIENNLIL